MSAPFVAEIRFWAGNFAPTGWALCHGQLMPISQNTALFSLLGTFYGGDGKSTFALPDLQDTVPINQGQSSASGSQYFIGETSGVAFVTLISTEMPVHTHNVKAYTLDPADTRIPSTTSALGSPSPGLLYDTVNTNLGTMAFQTISTAGGGQPHNNMMPFLALTAIIALQGIFPARS